MTRIISIRRVFRLAVASMAQHEVPRRQIHSQKLSFRAVTRTLSFDEAWQSSTKAMLLSLNGRTSSHPLHHPKPLRRQRQAVPADGGIFARRVHCPPDGAAVPLRQAVREFSDPKRIPRRAKSAEHVSMLIARLGNRQRRQGESRKAGVRGCDEPEILRYSNRQFDPIGADVGQE